MSSSNKRRKGAAAQPAVDRQPGRLDLSPPALQLVALDLRDPDDEPLGGEPPCMAQLLDAEGRVPDRRPTR